MSGKAIVRNKIIALCIISFLFINAIALMKEAMELEDAEQAYYSQWLRWGYDDQPPLYTWIQYFINQVIGVSKISFSLLRSIIFSGILIALYHFSKNMLKNPAKSELIVFCLVLIPVFIDLTFRRLSHTALLTLLVILSYQIISRLLQEKSFRNYLILGLLGGVGILSKYNYILFLGALFVTIFVDKELRKVFLNKYILLSILVCAILVTPHFYWLLVSNSYFVELWDSVGVKMESDRGKGSYMLSPFLSFLGAFLKLTAPLGVVMSILMLLKKVKFKIQPLDWFSKMFFTQLGVLAFFFLVFNSAKIEVRWLLPLLLPFLVLLVKSMKLRRPEPTSKYIYYLFIGVLFVQLIRTPMEKLLNIPSSVHFGFEVLGNKLQADYSDEQWILPNVTYGGNIRLLQPEKIVVSSDDFSLPESIVIANDAVEVILDTKPINKIPTDSLPNFGREGTTVYFVPN
ncbi:MAG: glycosyltransferase family 39 protein [Maribacter sp.]